eukprot:2086030-Alexandrium_andersonii.AAC.1
MLHASPLSPRGTTRRCGILREQCSVKWLHEEHERGLYKLNKVETNLQAAGVFTKPFADAKKQKAA